MDEKAVRAILGRLDAIVKMLALSLGEGKTQTEKVSILSAAGLTPKQIAETLGTTSNTVRVALVGLRKRAKRAAKPRGTKGAETHE